MNRPPNIKTMIRDSKSLTMNRDSKSKAMYRDSKTKLPHTTALSLIGFTLYFACADVFAAGFVGNKASEVNKEKWSCRFCPEVEGNNNARLKSNTQSKQVPLLQNKLNQQDKQEFGLDAHWNKSDEQGNQWLFSTSELGSDSFRGNASWKNANKLRLELQFRQIQTNQGNLHSSPYQGWSQGQLQLPEDWQPQSRQQDFDREPWSVPAVDGIKWQQLSFSGLWAINDHWKLGLRWQRQHRQGYRLFYANQMVQSVQLLANVDETWQETNLSVEMSGKKVDSGIQYHWSSFDNKQPDIRYDYAFRKLLSNAEYGQSATAPSYEQKGFTGYIHWPFATKGKLFTKLGSYETQQDQKLLPYSTLTSFDSNLPQNSLNGESQLSWASMRLQQSLSSTVQFDGRYYWQHYAYRHERLDWQPVISDEYQRATLSNPLLNNKKHKTLLGVTWRGMQSNQINAGTRYLLKHWQLSEQQAKAYQQDFYLNYHGKLTANTRYDAGIETTEQHAEQSNNVDTASAIMTQYYPILDSHSFIGKLGLQSSVSANWQLGIEASVRDTDYKNTSFGLKQQQQYGLALSSQYQVSEQAQLTGQLYWSQFKTNQHLTLNQNEIWHYQPKQTQRHLQLAWRQQQLLDGKLNWSFEFQRMLSEQQLALSSATLSDQWRPYQGNWSTFKLHSSYQLTREQALSLDIRYDRFDLYLWQQDPSKTIQINDMLVLDDNNYDNSVLSLQLGWQYKW